MIRMTCILTNTMGREFLWKLNLLLWYLCLYKKDDQRHGFSAAGTQESFQLLFSEDGITLKLRVSYPTPMTDVHEPHGIWLTVSMSSNRCH